MKSLNCGALAVQQARSSGIASLWRRRENSGQSADGKRTIDGAEYGDNEICLIQTQDSRVLNDVLRRSYTASRTVRQERKFFRPIPRRRLLGDVILS